MDKLTILGKRYDRLNQLTSRIAWSYFIDDKPLDKVAFTKLTTRRDAIEAEINVILAAAGELIDLDCED